MLYFTYICHAKSAQNISIMAKITKSLSSRAGLDGKHQVLLLVYIAKTNRFRLKSPIYLSPDLFDIDAGEIIIPNRYQASPTRLQEITQIKVSLDAYINRIQSILSVARPEHAKNSNDWKDWLCQLLELQDQNYLKTYDLTSRDITRALEDKLIRQEKAERERIIKAAEERAAMQKANRLTVVNALDAYATHHKLSITRIKSLGVIKRMLSRYILYTRATVNKTYELYADAMTSEDVENFKNYILSEAELAVTHKKIFVKIFDKFPVTDNPKIKRTISKRGENYVIDIIKRINAVYNWLNKANITDNNPLKTVPRGTEIYGTPIYINKEERDIIADFDLSKESSTVQVQRDIFIFQCLVGCRVCDLVTLSDLNVCNGVLEYVPQKTQDNAQQVCPRIPLSQRALDLIDKYKGVDPKGRLFPFISSQKYNEAIKLVFKACDITRPVNVRNPTTGRYEIKPICDVATSHMARRTFVGGAYKVVKDPNLIGAMSGHVPGSKAFARYRKIDDDDLRDVINKL